MKEALHGLVLALQFLTRVPLPVACPWHAGTCRWALRCYPLVGLLIGAALTVVAALGEGLPTPLLALTLLSLWVALSGGLHLDGVMDLADALGSNAPLERRWAIMKDSQVGSFAILALVFLLAWKGVLIWALLDAGISPWLWVALPALARFGALVLLRLAPLARREGLAWTWRQHLGHRDLALSLLPLLAIFGFVPGGAWLLGALLVFLCLYGLFMVRAFSGINGDIVGAAIEGGELWLLLAAWSWWWFGMA
ncbi:adenosylcobinamide-GDP ribazoletransferase [Halomonas icarae]|uniref:Adenosylcobinamide-GDP ribazoletransferase n=1 Tax=Halomonas icarae TaxID=2691040 RepID=A0A7X5AKP0_9GAMM|nr:adenosylcobinamide-GDP ribazoletransferase [Halomonas icarae]MDR5901198.1 adenosylcobinamide-GDP ribazoletransferase [Halomonas icarae]NAW11475.1 adenosylcobinamide-GDP ribazoletransferase [Halomonas icarae]